MRYSPDSVDAAHRIAHRIALTLYTLRYIVALFFMSEEKLMRIALILLVIGSGTALISWVAYDLGGDWWSRASLIFCLGVGIGIGRTYLRKSPH